MKTEKLKFDHKGIKPHSNEWYDAVGRIHKRYFYPWKSVLTPENGEDTFLRILTDHIRQDSLVLDAGCGHGELTLEMAALCREIHAFDRVEAFIRTAGELKKERNIANAFFTAASSKHEADGKSVIRIPAEDGKFDIIYSRRGPLNFIEDIPRVAANGAFVIQLNPLPRTRPPWLDLLPESIPGADFGGDGTALIDRVEQLLAKAGMRFESTRVYDVPELFDSKEELYRFLTWYHLDRPGISFSDIEPVLDEIFSRFAVNGKIELRHRRFLWTARCR